jgi:3'-5' exoribonuclease
MEANELGVVEEYTPNGQMLGHLVMGVKNIDKVASELGIDEELSMMVQHMILSHHYYPEYGSPKKPMFVEAELLHHIDMIDARVYDFETENKNLEPGQFSDRVYTLDNRRIYKKQ